MMWDLIFAVGVDGGHAITVTSPAISIPLAITVSCINASAMVVSPKPCRFVAKVTQSVMSRRGASPEPRKDD